MLEPGAGREDVQAQVEDEGRGAVYAGPQQGQGAELGFYSRVIETDHAGR